MKWLTNVHKLDLAKTIAALSPPGRPPIVVGAPRTTDTFTTQQLELMDYVGLYEPVERQT